MELLRVEQVAVLVGCSVKTINNWYDFKKMQPDSDLAKLLPEFIQNGERQTRYWKRSDIWKIVNFKNNVPRGRNGLLACVTQRYYKKPERG